jgi:DNA primase
MDSVEEIKNRLNIVDVVRTYGTLHPIGTTGNFKMLCPFHDDHSPSMVINERKGLAWCFVCNNGGDIFSFIQKIENCTFPESIKILAEKAGVALPDISPKRKEKNNEGIKRIFEILEETTFFFEEQLKKNSDALAVLKGRKLSNEIIDKFRVGFAPQDGSTLKKYLHGKGFSQKEMRSAGLIVAKDKMGEYTYDKFRNRIIFPIWSNEKHICAFGGRYIGDENNTPKYLNSPETPVFKKSEVLYGMNFAREEILQKKYVLLVEGYYDVLACHSIGIKNVVASSGTAFTPQQAKMLARSSKEIALAMDTDNAGKTAARKSGMIAFQNRLDVSVVSIPNGKDPDEAIRENKEIFLKKVQERKKGVEAFFEQILHERDPRNIEDKKSIITELVPLIMSLPREIERDHYLQILAEKMRTHSQVLKEEYQRLYGRTPIHFSQEKENTPKGRKITNTEYFISLLLAYPELFKKAKEEFPEELLFEEREKKIYKIIKETYTPGACFSFQDILQRLSPEEAELWRICMVYVEDKNDMLPEKVREEECRKTVKYIGASLIPKKLEELGAALRKGGADTPKVLEQVNKLTKLLHTFHHQ